MVDTTVIESDSSDYPAALRSDTGSASFPQLWAIGNPGILDVPLLGFFCSTRCPGEIILRTYDVVRVLRDADVPVIGGFHAPMEKECLDLLLRGRQPVVVCPARSIERLRIRAAWREPLAEGRLLVLSPFEAKHRRPTVSLTEQRNRFVAALAEDLFIAYAGSGSRTERFCSEMMSLGKRTYTLDLTENAGLIQRGVAGVSADKLIEFLS